MTEVVLAVHDEGFGPCEAVWGPEGPTFTPTSAAPTGLVAPGLFDLHVHGGWGVDTMTAAATDWRHWLSRLSDCGVEALLPTTVTASCDEVARAVAGLPDDPRVLGFHLEGPFLSPRYPGAQPTDAIVDPPDGPSPWDGPLDDPRLRRVTLAPERPGALDLVRRLSRRGVQVSMGHTDATARDAAAGVEAGIGHATHTFNAMRPLHHREPGAVGVALADDRVVAELIYDGQHVARGAAEVLLRCKGLDRVVAVSDGTAAVGLPEGSRLTMWGQSCVVTAGTVRLAGSPHPSPPSVSEGKNHSPKAEGGAPEPGALAGSTATLLDCFQNLADDFGPETAVRLCSLNPRRVMGAKTRPRVWLRFDASYRLLDRVSC